MKNLKKILLFSLMFAVVTVSAQDKFYKKDAEKTDKKIVGIKYALQFNETDGFEPKRIKKANASGLPFIAALLPSVVKLGLTITSKSIEKNLKKYTAEFETRNTYIGQEKIIPGFTVTRSIMLKDRNGLKPSLSMTFKPFLIKNSEGLGNSFVYNLTEINLTSSEAKMKKKYLLNNYLIELEITYFDGEEKKKQSMSPMQIQLIPHGITTFKNKEYITDKLPISTTFKISEIGIKVIETNSAKVRAEKLNQLNENYAENVDGIATTIINYFTGGEEDAPEE